MEKGKIGVEKCYLTLLAFYMTASSEKRFFKKNREFKKWLSGLMLLRNDTEIVGPRGAKKIFWLLSAVNGFIKREDKRIIITEEGQRFLWADEFKRFELFNDSKDISDLPKRPRYKGMPVEIVGDGYRLIRYKGSNQKSEREFTTAGWISKFLHLKFGDNMNSASIAFLHAEQDGERHDHSKTEEIFIFTAGNGYMELGEKRVRIPVNGDWVAIVEAGVSHRLVPECVENKGRFLNAIVISFPGWESRDEYKIGESRPRYDGPVE